MATTTAINGPFTLQPGQAYQLTFQMPLAVNSGSSGLTSAQLTSTLNTVMADELTNFQEQLASEQLSSGAALLGWNITSLSMSSYSLDSSIPNLTSNEIGVDANCSMVIDGTNAYIPLYITPASTGGPAFVMPTSTSVQWYISNFFTNFWVVDLAVSIAGAIKWLAWEVWQGGTAAVEAGINVVTWIEQNWKLLLVLSLGVLTLYLSNRVPKGKAKGVLTIAGLAAVLGPLVYWLWPLVFKS